MVKRIIQLFTDPTFIKFVMVGVINTIVGTTIMFVFYNLIGLSYWVSSASNYFFGSICSYILNKHFTFHNTEHGWKPLMRFTLNILICYLLAYGIAKPVMHWILTDYSVVIQENVSMALGMCLFIVFNYLGQRFFAFKQKNLVCILFIYFISISGFSQNNQLPILKLTGEFGYEYQEGTVTLLMPDGTSKGNLEAKIKWRGGTTNAEGKHKRNYKIKFTEDQQFFHMRTDNNWILDAGQADLFRLQRLLYS